MTEPAESHRLRRSDLPPWRHYGYYVVAAIGLVVLLIDLFGDGDQHWATIVVIVCVILLLFLRPGGLMKRMGGRS